MEIQLIKKIQEVFRLSEVFTGSGESITPIYKVRENVEKLQISENDMKDYFLSYIPRKYHQYVEQIIQKIYHPTEKDLEIDERLKLSSLR